MNYQALLEDVISLSQQAGDAILNIYKSADFGLQLKTDNSPLTKADLAAHAILEPALTNLLEDIPVISEESDLPPWEERRHWDRYWIIDPLDGTKEFIHQNDEFTVNIALIEKGVAILGVVCAPVYGWVYAAAPGIGAFKIDGKERQQLATRSMYSRIAAKLPVELVASRRHGATALKPLLQTAKEVLGNIELVSVGSSLKLCMVAEGKADLYPRLAPTCEWDTAAAQAVVEAAGGCVVDKNFNILKYNDKESILNPYFYVIGDDQYNWQELMERSEREAVKR